MRELGPILSGWAWCGQEVVKDRSELGRGWVVNGDRSETRTGETDVRRSLLMRLSHSTRPTIRNPNPYIQHLPNRLGVSHQACHLISISSSPPRSNKCFAGCAKDNRSIDPISFGGVVCPFRGAQPQPTRVLFENILKSLHARGGKYVQPNPNDL
jgi:hypothetical protein